MTDLIYPHQATWIGDPSEVNDASGRMVKIFNRMQAGAALERLSAGTKSNATLSHPVGIPGFLLYKSDHADRVVQLKAQARHLPTARSNGQLYRSKPVPQKPPTPPSWRRFWNTTAVAGLNADLPYLVGLPFFTYYWLAVKVAHAGARCCWR